MSADQVVLALDQGTTSCRAILFDRSGRICVQRNQEFTQHYPRPAWVEHDPEEIWRVQLAVAQQAMAISGSVASDVVGLGITNQRETTIVWDRQTGKAVYNAIVWQDRRTAAICDRLRREGLETVVQSRTGLKLDPYFSATKIHWILEHVEGARAAARQGRLAFGTVDTFLIWRLTGGRVHATDASNAARTMLFDIERGLWDRELLDALDIPESLLPEVHASSAIYGETDYEHFGGSIVIAGVAGDQQAATFGQTCFESGMVKNTYGTGNFMLMNTGSRLHRSAHGLLTTIAWQIGDAITYALEGSVFVSGAAVQWLRDQLRLISSAEETEGLARSVPDTGGVYVVPAFVGLGAPVWDPHARGVIVGLTRGSGRAQIVRAVLEAVAYQSDDVLGAMHRDTDLKIPVVRVDGGMTTNTFLMQFQADISQVRIERSQVLETTALGAAYLAGLATGYWRDQEELAGLRQVDRIFEPEMDVSQRDALVDGWRRAVERAGGWDQIPAS